ncbi:MAG: molybdenum cofactor guanylyltransferase [Verrucomicrobia bacterium]|nr:molybdenum cofactor guanylyltransferase [Verrucomicrobiota bacterium]
MNFSAVILAGGKSERMGRDKSFVELDGQTLLARQIRLVRSAGATEVFISGRTGVDYSAYGCRVLEDRFQDAGPLAGIQSAMEAMTTSLLLVLAVDLPCMSADFLRKLAGNCTENAGAVPRVNGGIEPLVAFYPEAVLPIATLMLSQNSLAVKNFIQRCEQAGLISVTDLPDSTASLFLNCNSPDELESIRRHQAR